MRSRSILAPLLAILLLVPARPAEGYSVLTHEQLIDLTWQRSIVPLLLSRYPTLTPQQIEDARAYAYGGCVIQDIGYYPFGDAFFSDLTHYVRSGDFVVNLFRDAGNANELAFAVGALSHYIGDTVGHSVATNLAVPVEFPKLRNKYGSVVNYAEGEHQHVQTEFGFDINEIAQHRFAPVRYLRHVGLKVPTQQVALAFYQTYGLRSNLEAKHHHRINVGGYRFAVRRLIPRVAYAVTILHRGHEPADPVGEDPASAELQRLTAEIATVAQQNDWATYRRHAGIGTYSLAGLLFVVPKVGPLKLVAVKGPTAQTEAAYVHSVLLSTDLLNATLRRFTPSAAGTAATVGATSEPTKAAQEAPRQSRDPRHPLVNRDLDTGSPVKPSGYRLTDDTYATLLHRLTATPAVAIPPGIKDDILAYYADLELPFATKKLPGAWAEVQKDLVTLQGMPTSRAPVPFETYGDADDDKSSAATGDASGAGGELKAAKP